MFNNTVAYLLQNRSSCTTHKLKHSFSQIKLTSSQKYLANIRILSILQYSSPCFIRYNTVIYIVNNVKTYEPFLN